MSWIKNVLIAVDQLGNALAGGNPDMTISGRTGYFAREATGMLGWYWRLLRWVIDTAFYPIDGPDHCWRSYLSECSQPYQTSSLVVAIFGVFIMATCVLLALGIYPIALLFPKVRFKPVA